MPHVPVKPFPAVVSEVQRTAAQAGPPPARPVRAAEAVLARALPTAEPTTARLPALRLVGQPVRPAPSPPPRLPPTTAAAALAALTGGAIAPAAGRHSTVSFLGRTAVPEGPAATAAPPAHGSDPPEPAGLAGEEPLHFDDLYDRLLTRLRTELLDERERHGRLIGDGRW